MIELLQSRWAALARELGAAPEPAQRAIDDILREYGSPARRYHSLSHVAACLEVMERHVPAGAETRHIAMAVFWHDYVYDPTRTDNEEKSAVAFEEASQSMKLDARFIGEVREMVLATKHDASVAGKAERVLYLVDVDLSILGEAEEVFDAYETGVREEYAFVPDDAFRAGRSKILRRLLERPHLYETPRFRAAYEASARKNLARSLERLAAAPT
jgi:predicted metal-dependent HD superfamily phosphohydrolase